MQLTAYAPTLPVVDLEATLNFFFKVLGFSLEFRVDNYAGIERDKCSLHLWKPDIDGASEPGTAMVYVFCDDVDAVYRDIVDRGGKPEAEPQDYDYGMRDFVIRDLDGNRISFGSESSEEPASPAQ